MTPEQAAVERTQQEERERNQLMAVFDFGLVVDQFLHGPIGQRMYADAIDQQAVLKDALVACDEDTEEGRKEGRELRKTLYALNQWQVFFKAYIEDGNAAEAQLRAIEGHIDEE